MAKNTREYSAFFEGISDFSKTGGPASYQKGISVDHRTDTRSVQLLPRTIKESGSVVTDLIKWAITPPSTGNLTYMYGETGNFYTRNSSGTYTLQRSVASSHGNGIGWFGDDNFIYYTLDSTIGRYGPIDSASPTFNDDFFKSQGGNRTNTNSLELLSASSQYASRASSGSLQVAGDLSISAQIYPYTLPTAGNTSTILSKWDQNGNKRSYKLDISPTSNYFGDGSDGALTIAADTTEAPIDSACTGTVGTQTLSATNASFAANQVILIHQTRGTGAGTWQRTTIQAYTAGTITTTDLLNATYTSGAQVRVLKQYSSVTVNSGKTYTAKAWNGTVGGILAFLCSGTVTVTGSINATGVGFRGGTGVNCPGAAQYGEGTAGAAATATSNAANGNGGGGGSSTGTTAGFDGSGGGGSNGTQGSVVVADNHPQWTGLAGAVAGSSDLTTMVFGGGGGGGSTFNVTNTGGNGGGIVFVSGVTVTITGSIVANGNSGSNTSAYGMGGGGAGGSILLKAQVATLGTGLITASGGPATTTAGYVTSNNGGDGRVHLDYLTSFTGTTSPTINSGTDPNLGSSSGQTLRLQVSSTGTNVETYSRPITLTVNSWQQIGCVWKSSTSTAEFFLNGMSLGTQTGALTAINANASTFQVGMYKDGTSTAQGFYNGLIDEVQVYNVTRLVSDFILSLQKEVITTTTGLVAYYQFNSVATDSTSNANDLTLSGSPAYSTNTPFIGATTRLDIDQSQAGAGNTYTLPTAIAETAANKLVFTPQKDPQKSLAVTIVAIGTGNWTLTIHDQFNNVIATKTYTNAQLSTGLFEFVFATPWRPLINANYHFHLTSTVADGTVQTQTASDLSTANYYTYFSFLVTDTQWHPVSPMLNFMAFGNERYIGTLRATIYNPNEITLPAGWKVRCFSYFNEYLAIGAWRGTTVDQFDSGRIFFWDGISLTYNFFIDVPEGAINAMLGTKGKLYFIAGSRGKLLLYEGGAQARKIKNLINSENTAVIDIYPGAMTMWRTLMRFGVAGDTQQTDLYQGVYTWGSINDKYPDSLSFDYPVSTGTYTGSTLRIGMVSTVNGQLLIGWNDNVSYGVDSVTLSNNVFPTGSLQFLIEDDDAMYHQKEAVTVTTQFKPLVSGQTVGLQYRLDRSSAWTTYTPVSTVGATTDRHVISLKGSRYREYEIGVNLATSTGVSPIVLGVSLEKEMLETEKRVG